MKTFIVISVACILLQVGAEDPKPQPRNKIPVPHYRPSVDDFKTVVLPISIQSSALRKVELPICDRLRAYMNDQLKRFHEQVWTYTNTVVDKIKSSKAATADVSTAVSDVYKANGDAISTFAEKSDDYLKQINDLCMKLNTKDAIRDVNKKILDMKAAQLNVGYQLANLTTAYEDEMQANYKPFEDVILKI